MGLTVLGHLPTILTLSLFVAVTATLTRMYGSSERVLWFSCGQGLGRFVRPATPKSTRSATACIRPRFWTRFTPATNLA